MESQLIYLLDSNIPSSKLEEEYAKTNPYKAEQLANMIIQGASEKTDGLFNEFKEQYNDPDFKFNTQKAQHEILIADFQALKAYKYGPSWNDDKKVKQSVLSSLELLHPNEHGKIILWIRLFENLVGNTAVEMILHKKKEFLTSALEDFLSTKKKYPEKWYALLHLIYVELGIEKQFIDTSDKQSIMAYGKSKYKFDTTGEVFYKQFSEIDILNIPRFVNSLPQKDKGKWQDIILELSNNHHRVKIWLKTKVK